MRRQIMNEKEFVQLCKKELYLDAYKKWENRCIEV